MSVCKFSSPDLAKSCYPIPKQARYPPKKWPGSSRWSLMAGECLRVLLGHTGGLDQAKNQSYLRWRKSTWNYPFLDETWKTLRRIVHHLSSFINLYNMYRSFSSDPFPLEESCFFSVSDCRRVYGTNMATPGNDLLVSKPTPWMAPEDGSEFSGWWFGDSVGGQQVWSRSVETGKGKVGSSETAGWPHSVGNPLP